MRPRLSMRMMTFGAHDRVEIERAAAEQVPDAVPEYPPIVPPGCHFRKLIAVSSQVLAVQRSPIALLLELHRNRVAGIELPRRALVQRDPQRAREPAGQRARTARAADGRRDETVRELHAFVRQLADGRHGIQRIPALIVGVDDDDIRLVETHCPTVSAMTPPTRAPRIKAVAPGFGRVGPE